MLSILLFNEHFYFSFGRNAYKPNNHGLMHLPHHIFTLGPAPCFWSSWVEGMIRQAKRFQTSGMNHVFWTAEFFWPQLEFRMLGFLIPKILN